MKVIKLFEDFNRSKILQEVDMCLVDLSDNGFTWKYALANYSQSNTILYVLDISLYRDDTSSFVIGDIKDSLETMIDYFDEKYGVTSYTCRKPNSPGPGIEIKLYDESDESILARQGRFKNLYYLNIQIKLGDED